MNMGKRVLRIIEKKQALSMRGGTIFSLVLFNWILALTRIHVYTHPSRTARKVERWEKLGGAYFKKRTRGEGACYFPSVIHSLRFSAFPSLARHAIKPFFPWQTDAFCRYFQVKQLEAK